MIIRKKSVRVLTEVSGNSSYIEKIYKKKETEVPVSRSDNGQAKSIGSSRIRDENCYDYCVYFNIDVKKAINMNLSVIDYDVTTSSDSGKFKYFTNLPEKNGLGVIASILGAKGDLLEQAKEVKLKAFLSGQIEIGSKLFQAKERYRKSNSRN